MRRSRWKALVFGIVTVGLLTALPRSASAADLDCTLGCNQLFEGLFWSTVQVAPTGTGAIDSFLRVQENNLEQGMNTSFNPTAFDEKTDDNFTRDIQLGEFAKVTIGSVQYYEILLDINEPSGDTQSFISLVGLKLCTSAVGLQYNQLGGGCSGGNSSATQVYNLDGTSNSRVNLDYDWLDNGSGKSDLFVYVPVSLLGTNPNTYIYLWSQFGSSLNPDGKHGFWQTGDGFEEWAVRGDGIDDDPPPPLPGVPEPSSMVLLGTGLALAAFRMRKSKRA